MSRMQNTYFQKNRRVFSDFKVGQSEFDTNFSLIRMLI